MKILVIEDDENIQFMISVFLENLGHEFSQASTRRSAEKIIKKETFDIILADYMLPDGTGLDLLKIIKESDPFAIVIFLTAYNDKELLVQLINNGAYAYMNKPFDFEDLSITLKKAFDYKKLLDENIRLSKEVLEKKEYENEFKLGQDVQNNILQETFLSRINLEVYGKISNAGFVGGDFYDVINVSKDEVLFIIGDVAGKGLKASIVMVMILSIIRTLVEEKISLKNIMTEINRTILKYTNISMHSTCFLGLFNNKTLNLKYCNAGHEYPAILRKDDLIFIQENDIFLGAIEEQEYRVFELPLFYNDKIIFYTDGLSDSIGISTDEILHIIKNKINSSKNIKEAVNNVIDYADKHTKYSDDKTLLCVCIENKLEKNNKITTIIKANNYEMKDLEIFLDEIYTYFKFETSKRFNVHFALKEIVTNAIQHAYLDKEGKIEITIENNFDLGITISVKDFGVGIPEILIERLGSELFDSYGPRGRGIFLAKKLVSNFSIRSVKNTGTIINFTIKNGEY